MSQRQWIIFDADNTLWLTEPLYNDARRDLCVFLATHGFAPGEVERFQQHRDHQLHGTYGYSACRFARSFEDTALHFLPSASAEIIRHSRQLALNVFDRVAPPVEGLEELLSELAQRYMLGVITAGERWVQERRLADLALQHYFKSVDIVETKDQAVFKDFCRRHNVELSTSWVVGDSLNSDIRPALTAGLRAVWVRAENWARVEGTIVEGEMVVSVRTLKDLLSVPDL